MSKSSSRPVVGRYTGRAVPSTRDTVARPAPSPHMRVRIGSVPDPENLAHLIPVAINRRVDILENDRSRRHISEAAYRAGREIQQAFEVSVRSSSNWNDAGASVDGASAIDAGVISGLLRADQIVALEGRIVKAVGEVGARRIREHLGEGKSYRDVADQEGTPGERGVTRVAQRFRQLLEDVADHWAAKGRKAA